MTDKEKAKAYDEAIERAKKLYGNGIIEEIFTELNEDDDEKIRKWIIDDIRYNMNNEPLNNSEYKKKAEKAIAWLEKQGKNSTDKTKPSFKVGDWIISSVLGIAHIIGTNDSNEFQLEYIDGKQKFSSIDYVNYAYDKWTIQDAKDGDVLYSLDSNQPFIYKKRNYYEQATAYCGLNMYGKFFVWSTKDCTITLNNYVPATKEQRDALMKAMNDAGYEWDVEKKELKKKVK